MSYSFPVLPGLGSRMEPLPLIRQTCPFSLTRDKQPMAPGDSHKYPTPTTSLLLLCSSALYPFLRTDHWCDPGFLSTSHLFIPFAADLHDAFIPGNRSCCFSAKQLFPLPLLSNTSLSCAFQGWSHCKPCLHTLSSCIVISSIMTIWIPFPFPRGKALSGVCSTQPRIKGWHSINNILWW